MLRTISQESPDFYALDALQAGWKFDVTQMTPSPKPSSARLIQSDRVSLVPMALNAGFNQTIVAKPGYINFGLPAVGSTPIWVGDQAITADTLVLFPTGEQGTSVSSAGFKATAIHLQQSQLDELLQVVFHRTMDDLLARTGANKLLASDQGALRRELSGWDYLAHSQRQAPGALLRQREEMLAESILGHVFRSEIGDSPRALKSERAMNTALEFIRDEAQGEISVTRLCKVAGCSISTLEYSFSRRFGVTPKRYIKSLQLSRVRRELSRFSEMEYRSITDIATRHGIWHMGQFAADYRNLFGELPSETEARCRT